MEVAKSGWVDRQSFTLKRWKHCWLVLHQNGRLVCYENSDKVEPGLELIREGYLPTIHRGSQISHSLTKLPAGKTIENVLQLCTSRDDELLIICADTPEEANEWYDAMDAIRRAMPDSQKFPLVHDESNSTPTSKGEGFGMGLGRKGWGNHKKGWNWAGGAQGGWHGGKFGF